MSDYDRDPNVIKIGEEKEPEIVLFRVKGEEQAVTKREALSIINHISGVLLADTYG